MKDNSDRNQQLDLNLQEPFSNKLVQARDRLIKIIRLMRINHKYQSFSFWIPISSSLTFIIAQIFWITNNPDIPQQIPLFSYRENLADRLSSKETLWLLPIISSLTLIITLLFYNTQKIERHTNMIKFLLIENMILIIGISIILFNFITFYL